MIKNIKKAQNIGDLLLNDAFVELLKHGSQEELSALKLKCREQAHLIDEASLLINNLKVNFSSNMSLKNKSEDWDQILSQISTLDTRKRLKRRSLYALWAVAVCVVGILFLVFRGNNLKVEEMDSKSIMFALSESVAIDDKEVQILAGDSKANVSNNQIITQTDKGDVLVDEKEQIESTAIQTEYITVVVPNGRRSTVKLNDGTTIWVNSGTKLIYPKVFAKDAREIVVDGEVYLDVESDATRPFVVHTNKMKVQVLGTKFNVNDYGVDKNASVALVSGSVEVSSGSVSGLLKPSQGFVMEDGQASIKVINAEMYTSWTQGYLLLHNEDLASIMLQLSRYYGKEIKLEERHKNQKFNGKLVLDLTLDEVLFNISLSTKMQYTKENNIYIIK